jgi:hypothetical protein
MPHITRRPSSALCGGLWALLACGAQAQSEPKPQPPPPVAILPTSSLAGQIIAVLPLTLIAADPALESDPLYAPYQEHQAGLLRADSLIGQALRNRGPEVTWILPPQLRKAARRSAGFVEDPDQMGQAVLRAPGLKKVPDPLRSSLRGLMSLTDARLALVPAAVGFLPDSAGQVRADLTLVMADSRNGLILWRSLASGHGKTPDQALSGAMAAVLPVSAGP